MRGMKFWLKLETALLLSLRRFNKEKLKAALKDHLNRIKNVPDLIEPEPGELAKIFLEVEFES